MPVSSPTSPTIYMPLYFDEFFAEVSNQPDFVVTAFLRAVAKYWRDTGCAGLPDNDGQLELLCEALADHWPRIKKFVFDDCFHFKLIDGQWHHEKTKKHWDVSVTKHEANKAKTAAATEARARARGKQTT